MKELGVQKFLALTEQQLPEESERIAVQGGAMSVNKAAMHEQEETVSKQVAMRIKTVEVEKIANAGAEQLPEQDQLVREADRNKVAVHGQEEIIEDQQGIVAEMVSDRSLTSEPT